MSRSQQWAANIRFLEEAIAAGDEIVLSSPIADAAVGSFFLMQVFWLIANGIGF